MKLPLRFLLVTAMLGLASAAGAQMLNPNIDSPNEPFSYFSHPTDVIGVMDARSGTEVTPEGYLYTGFGELMFFVGNPPRPVNVRVKELRDGYLPIIRYSFVQDRIHYAIQMFAATLDGKPESPLVNFVQLLAYPESDVTIPITAWVSVGVRYTSQTNNGNGTGDNRFRRPVLSTKPGAYYQAGVEFNPDWTYGFSGDAFLRDGKVMYLFPQSPQPEERLTLNTPGNNAPDLKPRKLRVWPDTPVGIVTYKLTFPHRAPKMLEFKMPYEPVAADDPLVGQMRNARTSEYYDRTAKFWNDIFARGIDIDVPEQKVNDTFKANLIYDLIARDKAGDDYVQTVNKFHYHAFWLRDASYIVRMYDVSGYQDIARQCLDFFARWQQPDGNFVSQGGQFDGWGQTMWAYGEHFRITHDRAFAEKVYPAVQKAVAWLEQARAADPMHLMPSTSPGDNEELTGHVTGHNFWALAGLKNAIALAEGLGQTADVKAWRREYDDYFNEFKGALQKATATTGGYIPPGLEGQHGQDWGNMLSVYPEIILDPHDPMVTATLNATRAKYQEGIMTYGDGAFLHHYLTIKNTETELVRGDQQMAIEELYALLVHTSSTHTGFEYDIRPWGDRDFDGNLAPHGWFAAKFRALVRDMMLREQGSDLHLLSAISPAWVKPGAEIKVERAPTNFGQENFTLAFAANGATLSLSPHFSEPPARTILHLPWFMETTRIMIDGRAAPVQDGEVVLPASAREVQISWTRRAGAPDLSYEAAVAAYKEEYRRRYEKWVSGAE